MSGSDEYVNVCESEHPLIPGSGPICILFSKISSPLFGSNIDLRLYYIYVKLWHLVYPKLNEFGTITVVSKSDENFNVCPAHNCVTFRSHRAEGNIFASDCHLKSLAPTREIKIII